MKRFCIIGSSTPLQKVLPLFAKYSDVHIQHVFLNLDSDVQAATWCELHNTPYHDATLLKENTGLQIMQNSPVDWILNVNSTVILSPEVLQTANLGALNLHPGKLPEYAGLHTHQWAIRNGESTFGVTLHHITPTVDAGNIAYQAIFPIKPKDTGLSLFLRCMTEGSKLVEMAIEDIVNNRPVPSIPQDLNLRKYYTHKMALQGEIDFSSSTQKVLDFIRAADYAPFQSPTYKPMFVVDDKSYFVSKASKSEVPLLCGKLQQTENGWLAGTKDGSVILHVK